MKKIFVTALIFVISTIFVFAADSAKLYNEGVDLLKSGSYAQAAEKFKASCIADKTNKAAYLGLANAYFKLKKWSDAAAALRDYLKLSPADKKAQSLLATVYFNSKEYAKATEIAKKALSSQPNDKVLLKILGNANYKMRKYGEAKQYFEKLIALKSTSLAEYHKLANIYYLEYKHYKKKKNRNQAFVSFNKAIETLKAANKLKENAKNYYLMGKYYYFARKYNDAQQALTKAVELKANDKKALYYLVKSLYKVKDYTKAAENGEKLAKLSRNSKTYALLGDIHRDNADKTKAKSEYALALKYYQKGATYSDKYGKYCAGNIKYIKSKLK